MRANRVIGDKKMPPQRMTMHWVHHSGGRMYWCNCMPAFRVGRKVYHPTTKTIIQPRMRSVLDDVLGHKPD